MHVRPWEPLPTSQDSEWIKRWVHEDPGGGGLGTEKGGHRWGPSTSSISCYIFTGETCVIHVGTVFDVSSVCGQLNNGPQRCLCQVPSTCEYHLIQQKMGVFAGVVKDAELGTFSRIIAVRGGGVLNAVTGVLVRRRQRSCEYRRGQGGQVMLDRG